MRTITLYTTAPNSEKALLEAYAACVGVKKGAFSNSAQDVWSAFGSLTSEAQLALEIVEITISAKTMPSFEEHRRKQIGI